MVFKTKFLKQVVVNDYDPAADGAYSWELTDLPLAAIWLTIKGDVYAANMCRDDYMLSVTALDVWMGSFNVTHYTTGIKALLMNCLLKQHWPYNVTTSSQTVDDVQGVSFPIMFGAPYINESMCLPASLSNRKTLTLTLDIATAALDDLLIDISEVILPDAHPTACIKQEEVAVASQGTGEHDLWLQRNWDILKILLYSPTIPTTAYTTTIERAGTEINDFPWGYKNVPWEHLHGELMDELEGTGPVEDHIHADPSSGNTGMPVGLEHWISNYAVLDFFYEKDPKWKLPCAGASTAKLKYNAGVAEAWSLVHAYYVPTAQL